MSFFLTEGESYTVRSLLEVPLSTFENIPDVEAVTIIFDNGQLTYTSREVIYNRFIWEYYLVFPVFETRVEDSIQISGDRTVNPMTDSQLLNGIYWHNRGLSDAAGHLLNIDILLKRQYDIIDLIDSFVRRKLGAFAVSINIRDFHELVKHPAIAEQEQSLESKELPSDQDINQFYSTIKDTVRKRDDVLFNPISLGIRSSSIKLSSLQKILGPNGYVTDVDSHIFYRRPVKASFVRGLTELIDLAIESRTAAMSTYYQSSAMQESEYLTRRIQSSTASVWRVFRHTDCKTDHYISFYMPPDVHLEDFYGKYYLNESTGQEELITVASQHLRDSVIKLRSILGCKLDSRIGVCERCYGQLAESIMPGDNIGQIAATVVQRQQTQKILSNKHLVVSAQADVFVFNEGESHFMSTAARESEIYMNPTLAGKQVYFTFEAAHAPRIQDIMYIADVDELSPPKLTSIKAVKITVIMSDGTVRENVIRTHTPTRSAYLTAEMLSYLKRQTWQLNEAGQYVVDLLNWDYDQPILDMPPMQFSTPAHMQAVSTFLTISNKQEKTDADIGDRAGNLSVSKTPTLGLASLYDLIQRGLSVNIVHLEVIVLSFMVESKQDEDYRIPIDKAKGEMGSFSAIMYKRDLALAISYEAHWQELFTKLSSYTVKYRHPHPFNKLLGG